MKKFITLLALFLVCSLSAQKYEAIKYISSAYPSGKTLNPGSYVMVNTTSVCFNLDFVDPSIEDLDEYIVPFYGSEPVKGGTAYVVRQSHTKWENHFMYLGYLPGPDVDFVISYQAWDLSGTKCLSTSNIVLIPNSL